MQELREIKISVSELKIGMYVSRLDRSWQETHFPLQGLLVESESDIERICAYCGSVYIDEKRCVLSSPLERRSSTVGALKKSSVAPNRVLNVGAGKSTARAASWVSKYSVERYRCTTSQSQELTRVQPIFFDLEGQTATLFGRAAKHQRLNIEPIADKVSDMVESAIRCPDALAWVCRIRQDRRAVYMHSLRLAVWGCILGRELGLNRFSLIHLTMVLLMTGIGKSRLSRSDLLDYCPKKPGPNYRAHLQDTLYQLRQFHFSCDDIINTLSRYCERIDGSGFPLGRRGAVIPFLAQVAGLVETFDLLMHPFDERLSLSPARAVAVLNHFKGSKFDEHLVEALVHAVGIYPTGTLVELSDKRVGVIVSQSFERRLQASVMPLLGCHGEQLNKSNPVDLIVSGDAGGARAGLRILRGLPATAVPPLLLSQVHEVLFDKSSGVSKGLARFLR